MIGQSELPPSVASSSETVPPHTLNRSPKSSSVSFLPSQIQLLLRLLRRGSKHTLCRHQNSCISSTVEVCVLIKILKLFNVVQFSSIKFLRYYFNICKQTIKGDTIRISLMMDTYIHTYLHIYFFHTYIYLHLFINIPNIYTYIHMYEYTYTFIHTYIITYICIHVYLT